MKLSTTNKSPFIFTNCLYLIGLVLLSLSISCTKTDTDISESNLIGEWNYVYELLDDGTQIYDDPFALLEFNYSDGFRLNENNTGNSIWFDSINGDFEWVIQDDKLIFTITLDKDTIKDFEYTISDFNQNTMMFSTPKNHTYLLSRQN